VCELPAPQIRIVQFTGSSNTNSTTHRHLKYVVNDPTAAQIRTVQPAGTSNAL
jgi:hypothetical protein